jgi:tetratricopeptide (TPR) repeat protein
MPGPLPANTRPARSPADGSRDAARAAPWLILVAVVLALLGALALWGPGRGAPGSADTQADYGAGTPAGVEDLTEQLAELGDLFNRASENKRDLGPLIDRLDALIAQRPGSAAAHTLRAQMLLEAGRPREALLAFQASLKLQPRQARVHQMAGDLAMNLKQFEEARHHYEQALSIEPGSGRYAVSLANLQAKLNEDDQAVQTLLAAIRQDSGLHKAYALLSDIYARKNKLGLALGQIDRAIDAVPDGQAGMRTAYVLKRAALLRRDNRAGESLLALQSLPPADQLRPGVMKDSATSWMMLGKPRRAAELYETALRLDPSNDQAAAEAARWRIKAGDFDAARKHIQALRRINPRHEALNGLDKALEDG